MHYLTLLATAVFVLVMSPAGASDLAGRPVTIIVPYAAGGPSDAAARRIAPELERELQQPVIIQNIVGATGAIGAQKLLQSEADGLTLLYGSPNELILAPATNPSVKYKPSDFANVGLVVVTPLALVTHMGSPFRSADEMTDYMHARPDRELTYGSVGVGSMQHLAAAKLGELAKLRTLHVPYKGAAPMMADLIGKQIDVSVMTLTGGTLGQIQAGNLRNLGVLSLRRSALADDLPTINEGRSFRGVEYSLWGGIFVAARTPVPIQEHLNHALNRVLALTSIRALTQANGGEPGSPMDLAGLEARYARETGKYRAIVSSLHLRLD